MSGDSWNPQQYDKFKDERSQPFFDLMAMLQPTTNPEVIDLGCGTGELTLKLHEHLSARRTFGADTSDEMLRKAHNLATASLQFQKSNIEIWRQSQNFDVVFSNAAIQWCKDHPKIFHAIKESLRPNGQIAIQMPINQDYPTHVLAREMGGEPSNMLTAEEYAQLLFNLGFKQQKVSVNVYGHVLLSRDSVIEWVKGTLLTGFKSRMSNDEYDQFLKEYSRRLLERLPDHKPFFYPFKRILIWAKL